MDPRHPDTPPDDATQTELDRVERALRGLGAEPAPADVVTRLDATLEDRLPAPAPARRRRLALRPALAIGAPLVALAAAAVVVAPHLGGGSPGGASSSAGAGAAGAEAATPPASSAAAATSAFAVPQARSTADQSAPAPAAGAAAPAQGATAAAGGASTRVPTAATPPADVGRRVQQAAEDAYRAAQLAIERSGSPAP